MSQVKSTLPSLAVAITFEGASGTPFTSTDPEGLDGLLSPTEFIATTVNVYETPFSNVSYEALNESCEETTSWAPGLDTTLYPVKESPPSVSGAIQVTVTLLPDTVASTAVGDPGTVLLTGGATGLTSAEGSEDLPVPAAFTAAITNE